MDRQTARAARRLVETERSPAQRTVGVLGRLLIIALLIGVIAVAVVIISSTK